VLEERGGERHVVEGGRAKARRIALDQVVTAARRHSQVGLSGGVVAPVGECVEANLPDGVQAPCGHLLDAIGLDLDGREVGGTGSPQLLGVVDRDAHAGERPPEVGGASGIVQGQLNGVDLVLEGDQVHRVDAQLGILGELVDKVVEPGRGRPSEKVELPHLERGKRQPEAVELGRLGPPERGTVGRRAGRNSGEQHLPAIQDGEHILLAVAVGGGGEEVQVELLARRLDLGKGGARLGAGLGDERRRERDEGGCQNRQDPMGPSHRHHHHRLKLGYSQSVPVPHRSVPCPSL